MGRENRGSRSRMRRSVDTHKNSRALNPKNVSFWRLVIKFPERYNWLKLEREAKALG